jgi:hypothetical protein
MASEKLRSDDRVLAFIDLGTNSIRMSVVRIKANQAYTILREEKEIVRLGEHVFGREVKLYVMQEESQQPLIQGVATKIEYTTAPVPIQFEGDT